MGVIGFGKKGERASVWLSEECFRRGIVEWTRGGEEGEIGVSFALRKGCAGPYAAGVETVLSIATQRQRRRSGCVCLCAVAHSHSPTFSTSNTLMLPSAAFPEPLERRCPSQAMVAARLPSAEAVRALMGERWAL